MLQGIILGFEILRAALSNQTDDIDIPQLKYEI